MILWILFGGAGALLRRGLGGALKHPRGAIMTALAVLAFAATFNALGFVLAAGVAAWSVVYWSMGHGSYMDMGTQPKPDNERFAPWLDHWFGKDSKPNTARDFAGMFLRYSVPGIPIALGFVLSGNATAGILPAYLGFSIATAYLIFMVFRDYLKHTPKWLDGFTSYGELAAGFIFYSALAYLGT